METLVMAVFKACPTACTALMQTTRISAMTTAYSTEVVPLLFFRNRLMIRIMGSGSSLSCAGPMTEQASNSAARGQWQVMAFDERYAPFVRALTVAINARKYPLYPPPTETLRHAR